MAEVFVKYFKESISLVLTLIYVVHLFLKQEIFFRTVLRFLLSLFNIYECFYILFVN